MKKKIVCNVTCMRNDRITGCMMAVHQKRRKTQVIPKNRKLLQRKEVTDITKMSR